MDTIKCDEIVTQCIRLVDADGKLRGMLSTKNVFKQPYFDLRDTLGRAIITARLDKHELPCVNVTNAQGTPLLAFRVSAEGHSIAGISTPAGLELIQVFLSNDGAVHVAIYDPDGKTLFECGNISHDEGDGDEGA